MPKKVMISLDEKVLKKIDREANKLGLTRSGFIASAIGEYMFQREASQNLAKKLFDNVEIKEALKEIINSE